MQIDTTVNLGNILTALIAAIGFAVAFTKMGGRIDLLTQRVKGVEDALKGQGDLGTRVAVIEVRQASHGQLTANSSLRLANCATARASFSTGHQAG
jgi:hypothetical protein